MNMKINGLFRGRIVPPIKMYGVEVLWMGKQNLRGEFFYDWYGNKIVS